MTPVIALGNPSKLPGNPDVTTAGTWVMLAWKEFDGETSHIFIKESKDRGMTWDENKKVLSSTVKSGYPKLFSYNGKIFLSWTSADVGHRFLEI